jgi:outer membrane protein OmpA-like peptidoglycan-associated protein
MTYRKEFVMRIPGLLIVVASAGLLYGCAATVPSELVSARQAYLQASEGPAAELAPAELHTAKVALTRAETSFDKHSDSFLTRDLAYVAQRKAEMAIVQAAITTAEKSTAQSEKDFQAKQGNLLQEKKEELTDARAELATAKQSADAAAVQLQAEKNARLAAEKETSDAMTELAKLAKIAEVKEDERGMIVTLSGSVLFRSGEAILMPGAESKLSQVYDALSTMDPRNLVVEGHTDSQGSDQYNLGLAKLRADTVRSYLVTKGYPSGLVQSLGVGEGRPIADNATAEGRANNRRVEIVIQKEANR